MTTASPTTTAATATTKATPELDVAAGHRLPVPANFPVKWERPDEASYLWTFDRLHVPEPITPADGVYFYCGYEHGVTAAFQHYDVPLRCVARRINTYVYYAIAPVVPAAVPPEAQAAQAARSQERLAAAMGRLAEMWNGEFLPEIKRYLDEWEAFDLRGVALSELAAHLEQSVARTKRLYELHMVIWLPFMMAISGFEDLSRSLFAGQSALDAYKLLQGFENKTVEGGLALWRLSRQALTSPAVREVLEVRAAAEVLPALEHLPEGREFLAAFRTYLAEYGQRGDRWGWSYPSWIEDPTPAIKTLKNYVTQPHRNLEAQVAGLVAERERLVAEARRQLTGHPPPVRDQFEFLLQAAQEANVLTEDHSFWIDFRCMYRVRRVFLECGRRFAEAGVLDQADDIFCLTPEEIGAAAARLPRMDRRPLAAARRVEMAYFGTITPPAALGTTPAGPPPDDPLSVALGKFIGGPPPAASDPAIVRGTAASPGTVRGIARVIRSLTEAGTLQPGDVLVAAMTAPPWTPLFAVAAAIVTDTGGILSHPAIVAREYGIPAVVGAGDATVRIADGQLVEVDGSAGVVRLL